jgi:cation diffusion facilitator CzcD-associated flavoprotein CzcO
MTETSESPHPGDEVEHLDVLVVGAGLSGIGAGHYLQAECPWASYAIFEARDAIGGTWDLFRYPGVRSDSDMFTLGYSFRPWDQDMAIADGPSILRYVRETAAVEGIDAHIRFRHRIVRAEWSTAEARWHVSTERTVPRNRGDGGADGHADGQGDGAEVVETVRLTCGFLFSCSGYYRYDRGYLPDFPGSERFGGTVVHPQFWPDDLDYAGKQVVVIGSGATAVTLVPALARSAGHVTMLQRSPSYVTSLPDKDPLANLARRRLPIRVSAPLVRWYKALTTQAFFQVSQRRPEVVKRLLRARVRRQLPEGFDVDTHFAPTYNPWDQRLCLVPNGDLFQAIGAGTASVVTDRIDTFTETGVRLESGAELPADIVVTATGLELLFLGGIELSVDGEAVDIPSTLAYRGMMLEGVPNLAMAVGYTNASWTLKCDLTCRYVTRLLNHLRDSGLRQCTPVNDDPSVEAKPLLGLTSGYVQRSQDRFPKQGSRFPWQVYQSYLRDYRVLRLRGIEDEAMRFTNPAPDEAGRVAVGAL